MAFRDQRNPTTRGITVAIPDETIRPGTETGREVEMMTVRKTGVIVMDGNFLRDGTKDGAETGLDRGRGPGSIPTTGGSEESRLWKDASLIGHPSDSKRLREGLPARRHLPVDRLVLHLHADRRLLCKSEGARC
jgi:hypothetical protein